MRIFKLRVFARFARREGLSDASLNEAIERAIRGLVDADLGSGLIKQRVAREGQGRRGGYRILLTFRMGNRSIFLAGFAKNERENLDERALAAVRLIADYWLAADAQMIKTALAEGLLIEVKHDG